MLYLLIEHSFSCSLSSRSATFNSSNFGTFSLEVENKHKFNMKGKTFIFYSLFLFKAFLSSFSPLSHFQSECFIAQFELLPDLF